MHRAKKCKTCSRTYEVIEQVRFTVRLIGGGTALVVFGICRGGKMKKVVFAVSVIMAVAFSGCQSVISFTAIADDPEQTTAITLSFSEPVSIDVDDISVGGNAVAAEKGALTGEGTQWTLEVFVRGSGELPVRVSGRRIEGMVWVPVHSIKWSAEADSTDQTTAINLSFGKPVYGLSADDITIRSESGKATKGAVTGSGTQWQVEVSQVSYGTVSVVMDKYGIEQKAVEVALFTPPLAWTANADSTVNTTVINLVFDQPVEKLAGSEITLGDATGSAIKGTLTGSQTKWNLAVNTVKAGTVSVSVDRPGIKTDPVEVALAKTPSPSGWVAVSAGTRHTVAIASDGSLWAWGWNEFGQLGDGTNGTEYGGSYGGISNRRTVPTRIGTDNDWATASAGTFITEAIKKDGSLWAWGNFNDNWNDDGVQAVPAQMGTDTDWAYISSGLIKTDGSLWFASYSPDEGADKPEATFNRIGTDNDWKKVGNFEFAIKKDGSLWKLDHKQFTATQVGNDYDWAFASSVSFGIGNFRYNLAIKTDGSLLEWFPIAGEWGTSRARDPDSPSWKAADIIGMASNWASATAIGIRTDGSLWQWGWYESGMDGSTQPNDPVRLGTDNDWVSVSAGGGNFFGEGEEKNFAAIKADGTLWAWGRNSMGQLGTGTTGWRDGDAPVQVTIP